MSSVSRFLRQRQTGQTLLPYSSQDTLYVLLPGSGNYVGNYPNAPLTTAPGYVVASAPNVPAGAYLRDMGKTIFCAVQPSGPISTVPGFFRAVQIINPGIGAGDTGVLPANAFGVGLGINGTGLPGALPSAGNPGDMGYNTYYIPISVGGIVASDAAGVVPLTLSDAGIRVGEQL